MSKADPERAATRLFCRSLRHSLGYSSMYSLSRRVRASAAPPIPRAAEWAAAFTPTPEQPLLNLSQGVPGAPPPQAMLDQLADAVKDPGTTGYGALAGDLALREVVAEEATRIYAAPGRIAVENVAITAGCNLASISLLSPLLLLPSLIAAPAFRHSTPR